MKNIMAASVLPFLFAGILNATDVKTSIDISEYVNAPQKYDTKAEEINKLKVRVIENECEINKLKKVLAKILSKKNEVSYSDYNETNLDKKNNIINTCNSLSRNCKKVSITDSYKKFNQEKKFKVSRSDAFLYEYPSLKAKSKGYLTKGTEFKSLRYTQAGWVETNNGLWIKGYTLNPPMVNETSREDIKKWNKNCIKIKEI